MCLCIALAPSPPIHLRQQDGSPTRPKLMSIKKKLQYHPPNEELINSRNELLYSVKPTKSDLMKAMKQTKHMLNRINELMLVLEDIDPEHDDADDLPDSKYIKDEIKNISTKTKEGMKQLEGVSNTYEQYYVLNDIENSNY